MRLWSRWGIPAVLAAVALLAAFAIHRETRENERDRREILSHVAEMERIIRAHDARVWLHVEADGHTQRDAEHDAAHQAMLRDFERLSHLRGFAMRDVEIEVAGDTALARYRIEAEAKRAERPPVGGELRFGRSAKGWEMTGHTLIEAR